MYLYVYRYEVRHCCIGAHAYCCMYCTEQYASFYLPSDGSSTFVTTGRDIATRFWIWRFRFVRNNNHNNSTLRARTFFFLLDLLDVEDT